MRDGACAVPRPSAPWHRLQCLSYRRSPESSAALPAVHAQTAITTTRQPNTARVANLSLVTRLDARPGRIRLRVADGKLVVRLDELSVLKVHEERLLGMHNPTAVLILQDSDLLMCFH